VEVAVGLRVSQSQAPRGSYPCPPTWLGLRGKKALPRPKEQLFFHRLHSISLLMVSPFTNAGQGPPDRLPSKSKASILPNPTATLPLLASPELGDASSHSPGEMPLCS
jgi:hypothetical protein